MFKWIFIGNLTRDMELQYTPDGKPFARFTVAVDIGWGDNKTVSFVNCTMFGRRAEILGQRLGKGTKVYIEATPYFDKETGKPRLFQRKNGEVDVSIDATVQQIEILVWQEASKVATDQNIASKLADAIPAEEEEIPF